MMFGALWAKIATGTAALALVIAGVQTWRLSGARADLETKRNQLATEKAAHAVTRASLTALQTRLSDMIAAGERQQQAAQEAAQAQKPRSAALDRQIEAIRAEKPAEGKCETPRAVMEADGL
jgi:hypothetical protein